MQDSMITAWNSALNYKHLQVTQHSLPGELAYVSITCPFKSDNRFGLESMLPFRNKGTIYSHYKLSFERMNMFQIKSILICHSNLCMDNMKMLKIISILNWRNNLCSERMTMLKIRSILNWQRKLCFESMTKFQIRATFKSTTVSTGYVSNYKFSSTLSISCTVWILD